MSYNNWRKYWKNCTWFRWHHNNNKITVKVPEDFNVWAHCVVAPWSIDRYLSPSVNTACGVATWKYVIAAASIHPGVWFWKRQRCALSFMCTQKPIEKEIESAKGEILYLIFGKPLLPILAALHKLRLENGFKDQSNTNKCTNYCFRTLECILVLEFRNRHFSLYSRKSVTSKTKLIMLI